MKNEHEIYQAISECLEKRRLALNISKRQLSIRTDITPVYLREVLRGERKPSVIIIMTLCEAMDMKASDLFKEIEKILE